MSADPRLIDIAAAVGDGAIVDWSRVAEGPDARLAQVIRQLRLVERIASVHASTPPEPDVRLSASTAAHRDALGSALAQEAGQLRSPWGVAVDGAGDVYVTDTGNHRIEKFDKEGNFITQWGGFGNGKGQFNFPYGIAVDARGSVFAVDSGNTRVEQFMPADEGTERLQEDAETVAEIEQAQGTSKSS